MNILKKLFIDKYQNNANNIISLINENNVFEAKKQVISLFKNFNPLDENDIYLLFLLDQINTIENGIEINHFDSGNNFLLYDLAAYFLRQIYISNDESKYKIHLNNMIKKTGVNLPVFLYNNLNEIKEKENDSFNKFNKMFSILFAPDLVLKKYKSYNDQSMFYNANNIKITQDIEPNIITNYITKNSDYFEEIIDEYMNNIELYNKMLFLYSNDTFLYNNTDPSDINYTNFTSCIIQFNIPYLIEEIHTPKIDIENDKIVKIAAGRWYTCLLRESGNLTIYEHLNDELTEPDQRDKIKYWNNIKDLFLVPGNTTAVGITKNDETIFYDNGAFKKIIYSKKIIKGYINNLGNLFLTEDGHVFTTITYEENPYYIQLNKKQNELQNIIDIVPISNHGTIIAIRNDGKCFTIGGTLNASKFIEELENIKNIVFFDGHIIGVTKTEKLISNFEEHSLNDKPFLDKIKTWETKKIKKIVAGRIQCLVLFEDGQIDGISTCYNHNNELSILRYKDVIDITCGQDHSAILTKDNKVYITTNNTDQKYYGAIMEVK